MLIYNNQAVSFSAHSCPSTRGTASTQLIWYFLLKTNLPATFSVSELTQSVSLAWKMLLCLGTNGKTCQWAGMSLRHETVSLLPNSFNGYPSQALQPLWALWNEGTYIPLVGSSPCPLYSLWRSCWIPAMKTPANKSREYYDVPFYLYENTRGGKLHVM